MGLGKKTITIKRRIGKRKKTVFDILMENSLITPQFSKLTDIQSCGINILHLIDTLHSFDNQSTPKPKVKFDRIRNFIHRAKEQQQKRTDKKGRHVYYRYDAEQKYKLSDFLLQLSDRCKKAAKEIKEDAMTDPNSSLTAYYIEIENQFCKTVTKEEREETRRSIFGNIIQ